MDKIIDYLLFFYRNLSKGKIPINIKEGNFYLQDLFTVFIYSIKFICSIFILQINFLNRMNKNKREIIKTMSI